MPDQANAVSRSWRRYLRFSVRGLIVLVLVIGAGMGWIVRSARIQREAVAAIVNDRGGVLYDWEWSNGEFIPGGKLRAPRWIVDLIGIDYFGHVTEVWLTKSSAAPDAVMEQAGSLTRLQRLEVDGSSTGDVGLVHLKELTNLSELDLSGTRITDVGLVHLKGLTKIASLYLSHTQVTDAGLVHLKGLTNLSILYLYDTRVTDAGIDELKQALPSLNIIR